MKKKLFALFLALTFVVMCLPLGAMQTLAETAAPKNTGTPVISVGSVYARAGQTVDVDVSISNNTGIAGARITLTYDPKLTLLNAVSGETFAELDYTRPGVYTSPCNFNWDSENAEASGNGTILTLTFKVSEDAEANENLPVSLSYLYGDIYDNDLNSIAVSFENGVVSVISFIYGDVNDDGVVNGKDVTLIRRYNAGGYDGSINEAAADVNLDGVINGKDVTLIRRYIAGGYGVTLPVGTPTSCNHTMEHHEAASATCTEDGNIEYWHCTTCGKYFSDANGRFEISQASTVIHATGHSFSDEWSFDSTYHWHASTCEHETAVGDRAEHTFNADGICTVCGASSNTPDPSKPYRIDFRLVEYNTNQGDSYIATQEIDNSANEEHVFFSASETFELKPISCPGYEFLGWYTPEGVRMTSVPRGTDHDLILYARWREIVYDITYRVYMTPIGNITDERYLHYTVSKGLQDLPNPTINNYKFLGWYIDVSKTCGKCGGDVPIDQLKCSSCDTQYVFTEGGDRISRIPVGTTGNITLNAEWTSYRNLARKVDHVGDPTIAVDENNGVFYFAYEIGTIENVPVSDPIWTIQDVEGLEQQFSTTVTTSISQVNANQIAETISNSTVDSGTWRLTEDWNESTHVDEEWAEERGMTVEEAETILKGTTNTYSVTTETGGSSTQTDNTGTSTLKYGSESVESGVGTKMYQERNEESHVEAAITARMGTKNNYVEGTASAGVSVGGKDGSESTTSSSKNVHSGNDTTELDTHTSSESRTWNNSQTASNTVTASQSNSVRQALSTVLSSAYNVGTSYASGGAASEEQGFSNSSSNTVNSTSTLTYSTAETTTTTKTYSTAGRSNGWYRLVMASKLHVYGVVGYDVASNSYFSYTHSIMEDDVYEFLDYSPEGTFNDNENCALQFNIPNDIMEFVDVMTWSTEGLDFITNSTNGTATVVNYRGTDSDVTIPSFYVSGGSAYRVTNIRPNAFAGKSIKAIILSEYIDELPDGAFKNCSELESVFGRFTRIGNEAFSGCTSLKDFTISSHVRFVGEDAFSGVNEVSAYALNEEAAYAYAKKLNSSVMDDAQLKAIARELTQNCVAQIINSGTENVVLDISTAIEGVAFNLAVPAISSVEILGGRKTYSDFKLTSDSATTIVRNVVVQNQTGIPFEISSENMVLDTVIVNAPNFVLLAERDGVNFTLVRDNSFISASGNAMVCKNPTFTSESTTRATIGVLNITGNMYVCGNPPTPGSDYIDFTNGEIIYIGNDQFDQLVRGYFTVTFNPNGGSVDPTTKNVGFGEAYGELPVPTRSTYDFVGWFTEPSGGTQITADTVSTTLYNQTLYAHWELKQYTVTFDANGGNCSTLTMPAIIGMAPSSLPTATKNYHNFLGWFTEDDIAVTVANYNAVIAEMDPVELVTNGLTLYAHYELKPVSNWVLYENMPSDAQIVQQKWTYTKTTTVESTNTSMPGYTLVRSYWRQTGSGNFNYASFPSGYDTNNWYYQNWNRSAYSSYENNTNKRVVNTNWAGWIYWHWMYNVGWANVTNRAISHRYGYWNSSGGTSGGFLYQYFTAIASATDCPYLDNMYCCSQNLPSYNAISIISDTTNVGTPRMFRFNYYNCSYTDYEKVFVYQKVENLESSTPVTPSSTITNVQHWVRYRDK